MRFEEKKRKKGNNTTLKTKHTMVTRTYSGGYEQDPRQAESLAVGTNNNQPTGGRAPEGGSYSRPPYQRPCDGYVEATTTSS